VRQPDIAIVSRERAAGSWISRCRIVVPSGHCEIDNRRPGRLKTFFGKHDEVPKPTDIYRCHQCKLHIDTAYLDIEKYQ